jgi:hypothetical protein
MCNLHPTSDGNRQLADACVGGQEKPMARTTPRLEPVKRSRGDVQLELHLRIGGRHSLLLIRVRGIEHELVLHARYVPLVLFLIHAWNQDEGAPERLRGFRSRQEIVRGMELFRHSMRGPLQDDAVAKYSYHIRRALKEACPESIDLIETVRGAGYRIGPVDVAVVPPAREDCE